MFIKDRVTLIMVFPVNHCLQISLIEQTFSVHALHRVSDPHHDGRHGGDPKDGKTPELIC